MASRGSAQASNKNGAMTDTDTGRKQQYRRGMRKIYVIDRRERQPVQE
jgi:hypothetical protein